MRRAEADVRGVEVTLYTKSGCHLCDDLWDDLQALQAELDFSVVERDIERDPTDFERFHHLIPVVDVPGSGLMFPPHEAGAVRDAITSAVHAAGSRA